jgi:hypothetical protein
MAMEGNNLLPVLTICEAFDDLGRHVYQTLRTQVGDAARLQEEKCQCLRFLCIVDQVSCGFFGTRLGVHFS